MSENGPARCPHCGRFCPVVYADDARPVLACERQACMDKEEAAWERFRDWAEGLR